MEIEFKLLFYIFLHFVLGMSKTHGGPVSMRTTSSEASRSTGRSVDNGVVMGTFFLKSGIQKPDTYTHIHIYD